MAVATPRRVVADVSAEGDAAGSGERSLVETALKLAFQSDYEGVCSTLLDLVETTFAAGASWVLLHDARTNCLVTAAYRGPGAEAYADVRIPSGVGIMGLAFSSGPDPIQWTVDVR